MNNNDQLIMILFFVQIMIKIKGIMMTLFRIMSRIS